MAQRRAGATRRIEVALGAQRTIIEVDVPGLRAGEVNRPIGLKVANAAIFTANGEARYFRGGGIEPVIVRAHSLPGLTGPRLPGGHTQGRTLPCR